MCGILAFIGKTPDPARLADALRLIGHRGQDGLGIWHCREIGNAFSTVHFRQTRNGDLDIVRHLPATEHMTFVAHWRYATRGGSRIEDVHPILINGGDTAIAHNGQFQFPANGPASGISDTLLFSRRVESQEHLRLGERIHASVGGLGGAFALVAADQAGLTTARDRFGIRPLFWGRYHGGIAFSSETPALDRIGCIEIAEIAPGSVNDWSVCGATVERSLPTARRAACSFESIYFHAADGQIRGRSVDAARQALGRELARESPADGDIVVAVPRSGISFARGFAGKLDLPLIPAISLSPDTARTFIEGAAGRAKAIQRKYLVDPAMIEDRSVIVVDDSLVRGATMAHLTQALRQAGARQVHARIGSPRFTHPCFFGIDVPDRKELICDGRSLSEVSDLVGLDSLGFLSIAGLHRVLGNQICAGCFSGSYPEGALSPLNATVPRAAAGISAMATVEHHATRIGLLSGNTSSR